MSKNISKSLNNTVNAYNAGVIGKHTSKEAIYIKLDSNVLDWFKKQGSGYQIKINEVLRRFVLEVDSNNNLKDDKLIIAQKLFEKYYTRCFWHMKPELIITEKFIDSIIQGLRTYGGREGFLEAEKLCQ